MKTLPYGVSQQLEDLRAVIRGCNQAIASGLAKWEEKEFQETRDEAQQKLSDWEASIAMA